MRFHIVFVVSIVFFSLSFLPTSARFFPNISSLPPGILPNATKSGWDSFHKFAGCHAGDKKDGLSNLKKYFNEFGYIPNSPANFSDEFDDALESALKTYQKNFNLNETGQLDNATLQQIQRPRCGNADIVNGTSTMNSGKTSPYNTTTTTHFHTVGHYTFFPGEPRWPSNKPDLTYSFLPDNGLTDDVKAVFSRAFDRWSTVIPLNFTQTDSFNSADIRIGFFVGDHGDGEPFDGVLGTLAHAFSPPNGRFHLDGAEDWVVSGDISKSSGLTAVDLESVAVHEIGHLLGLGHSSIEDAIMYPTISAGTRKVELASDDIAGIQVLYGSNPNYNGSSTASTQERESSGGTHIVVSLWGLFVSMAVGLVVLLVL